MKSYISPILIIVLVIASCFAAVAQPPQKMTYQAVIRDGQNMLVPNRTIGVKISILQTYPNGIAVYEETHQATTNGNGLLSIEVGTGIPTPGSNFSAIDWAHDNFYLQSEIDLNGGNQYTLIGSQQLITVPYSFHSGTSTFSDSSNYNNLINRPVGQNTGDILYWDANQSEWQIIPVGSTGQVLTLGPNGIPQWYSTVLSQNAPPVITTDSVFNISGTVVQVGATIVSQGSSPITVSGVCWSHTNPYPSLGNSTNDGSTFGSFSSIINNLTPGITWYIRAYATNNSGTGYGEVMTITSPIHCGTVSDYDGNVYQTIYIGNQCWMRQNLKTTRYSNGSAITRGYNGDQVHSIEKYYFIYNDIDSNKNIYGLLYTYKAVMNGAGVSDNNPSGIQGVCPTGWHVPSHSEWCELENYLEPGIDANCSTSGYRGSMVNKLARPKYWLSDASNSFAPGYWHTDSTNFNQSQFSAIPGGKYNSDIYPSSTSYTEVNQTGYWWTCSSTSDVYYKRYRSMTYNNSGINSASFRAYYDSWDPHYAFSVRCIKNE